jgi:HD superfamily phosphodiesterase
MRERIPERLAAGYFDSIPLVAELKKSAYFDLLMKAFEELKTERLYKSPVHGMGHIERVMLLGAIIAMQQDFSRRETELLLYACSYHDLGRIDDSRDDRHGKRSADMLAGFADPGIGAEELRCIRSAVATHSTKDSFLDSFAAEYRVPDEYMDLCRLLCRGLKDADNLDRVRIGDLDVRHLRFEKSRGLAPTAQAIFSMCERINIM